MLLRVNQLPGVDNPQNYPLEIVNKLEKLLLSGVLASPDPKRKGFYDVENDKRTFFIYISPISGRAMLLATCLSTEGETALVCCSENVVPCTA